MRNSSIEVKSGASAQAAWPMVKATARPSSKVLREMLLVASASSGPPMAMPQA